MRRSRPRRGRGAVRLLAGRPAGAARRPARPRRATRGWSWSAQRPGIDSPADPGRAERRREAGLVDGDPADRVGRGHLGAPAAVRRPVGGLIERSARAAWLRGPRSPALLRTAGQGVIEPVWGRLPALDLPLLALAGRPRRALPGRGPADRRRSRTGARRSSRTRPRGPPPAPRGRAGPLEAFLCRLEPTSASASPGHVHAQAGSLGHGHQPRGGGGQRAGEPRVEQLQRREPAGEQMCSEAASCSAAAMPQGPSSVLDSHAASRCRARPAGPRARARSRPPRPASRSPRRRPQLGGRAHVVGPGDRLVGGHGASTRARTSASSSSVAHGCSTSWRSKRRQLGDRAPPPRPAPGPVGVHPDRRPGADRLPHRAHPLEVVGQARP